MIGCLDSNPFLRADRVHSKVTLFSDVHFLELPSGVPNVVLTRSVDVVFWILKELNPVSDPSCNPGDSKEHRVHVSWEAHSSVNQPTVEINIRIKLATNKVLIRKSNLFEFQCNLNQRLSTTNFKYFKGYLNSRIFTFLTILARGS